MRVPCSSTNIPRVSIVEYACGFIITQSMCVPMHRYGTVYFAAFFSNCPTFSFSRWFDWNFVTRRSTDSSKSSGKQYIRLFHRFVSTILYLFRCDQLIKKGNLFWVKTRNCLHLYSVAKTDGTSILLYTYSDQVIPLSIIRVAKRKVTNGWIRT